MKAPSNISVIPIKLLVVTVSCRKIAERNKVMITLKDVKLDINPTLLDNPINFMKAKPAAALKSRDKMLIVIPLPHQGVFGPEER